MDLNKIISDPNATLVDVRQPFELGMGSVQGAINIPLNQIPEKVEYLRSLSKPLVLFCASGNRSGQATSYLQSLGIENVYNGGGFFIVNSMRNQQVS